jgi:TRAP-type C4-dicarboxylate transport system permease small subunit
VASGNLIGRIGRLNGQVTWWLARIACFVLALIAVVTFCDVIARYVFNRPFSFTVEGTELMMGLIVFLGVGLTTHEDGHISVDIVTIRLSDWMRALFTLITNLLAFGFLLLMVWRVWLRASVLLDKGDTTQILLLPIWPFAFAMAIGSIFFLTGVLVHILYAAQRLTNPNAPPPPSAQRPYSE